jgi:hypothetical protein
MGFGTFPGFSGRNTAVDRREELDADAPLELDPNAFGCFVLLHPVVRNHTKIRQLEDELSAICNQVTCSFGLALAYLKMIPKENGEDLLPTVKRLRDEGSAARKM